MYFSTGICSSACRNISQLYPVLVPFVAYPGIMKNKKKQQEFSKRLISDIRLLLWVVTIGGLVLAAYCIRKGYTGSLPWLTAMVGLPWTAHGTVCAFYLNLCKSDHKEGGITFEAARAAGFQPLAEASVDSPAI